MASKDVGTLLVASKDVGMALWLLSYLGCIDAPCG